MYYRERQTAFIKKEIKSRKYGTHELLEIRFSSMP